MIVKFLSGGQTGADQAALRAARAAGIPTGGWAPLGWLTEAGPAPWLGDFGLREAPDRGYPARTRRIVEGAHAVVWFGNRHSPGGRLTFRLCEELGVPAWAVIWATTPDEIACWLTDFVLPGRDDGVNLMVAGNRASSSPDIGARAEAFLGQLFRVLKGGTS